MNPTARAMITATAALTLVASAAFAFGPRHDPMGGPEFEERRGELFAAADADSSGGLTPAEMGTLRELIEEARREARFDRVDADGSGEISLEELENGRRHHRPGRPFRR